MFQKLVRHYGVNASTLLVTGGTIIISVIVIISLGILFGEGIRPSAITTAIVIPLVLCTPLAFLGLNYLQRYNVADETLQLVADTDPLTGVFNRKHFNEFAQNEFALAKRHGTKFSILLVDIDHFKNINETHGRSAGDQVLRILAEMCRGQMRRSDIFARLENEEFICLLPYTPNAGALEFAERLRKRVNDTTVTVDQHSIQFTISIGVKTYSDDPNLEAMMHVADQALQLAKAQGRNRTVSA